MNIILLLKLTITTSIVMITFFKNFTVKITGAHQNYIMELIKGITLT